MVRIIFWIIINISTWYSVAPQNEYDEVIYAEIGQLITTDYYPADDICTIITNANETFHTTDEDEDNKSFPDWLFLSDFCEFEINVNTNHNGTWIVKTDENEIGHKIYIFVYKIKNEDDGLEQISASVNASVSQWLPSDSMEITSCYLIHKFQKDDRDKYLIYDLYQNIDKNDIQLLGKCGVRLKATQNNEGNYYLYAMNGKGSAISSKFQISINEDVPVYTTQYINETVLRGKENHIISHGSINSNTNYCTITDPHGKVIKIENDICLHKISLVTSYHHGMWILRKFDSGQNEAFDYQYNLTVVDDILRMRVNVTYNKDNVTILCNTTGQHVIRTCKFINPSDEYISVVVGMSTEKYEYYGESFGEPYHYQECGIVVHNLSAIDYGTWKCVMTTENASIIDSLIHVHDDPREIEISPKNPSVVHVTKNSSFIISCSANRRLSYCWLQSPNGTMYFVGNENLGSRTLQYEGLGLAMGECGARVPSGSKSYDDGVWSCHMGIQNGPDLQTKVTIQVFDSSVVPRQDKIEVSSGDRITLSVIAISISEFETDNCEWVSPVGVVIQQTYEGQYFVTSNKSSCSLEIIGVNEYEHIGRWTCNIFHGDDKIQSFVEVVNQSYNTWWIFLIVTILVSIILLIAFYFIIKMAKKVMNKDNLLSNTSMVTTDDPPYMCRTQI